MQQLTIHDAKSLYTRISKRKARKLWEAGNMNIAVCPAKLRPGFPWAPHIMLGTSEEHYERGFNKLVVDFEWYNCSYETGYYSAFYIVSRKV